MSVVNKLITRLAQCANGMHNISIQEPFYLLKCHMYSSMHQMVYDVLYQENPKQTSSPLGNVLMYGLLHRRIPVVSLSDPPRQENPSKASASPPIQSA